MFAEALITKVVTEEARAIVVGSVRWIVIPVSPVTPFNIKVLVLPAAGTMVAAVGTVPAVGTVIVLLPVVRVRIWIWPAELVFCAAGMVSVPVGPPV